MISLEVCMCGIVGYIGEREATPILLEGLSKLEYRGYDSAGIALLNESGVVCKRSVGKLKTLFQLIEKEPVTSSIGIGHTRWATHGRPSFENAHPHVVGGVAVVHNGIIENHSLLREELIKTGREFLSDTDTEIFAHLVSIEIEKGSDIKSAVLKAVKRIEGSYALVVISEKFPQQLICAKNASPLVIGLAEKENFIASDIPAVLAHTRKFLFLEDNEIAVVTRDSVAVETFDGKPVSRNPKTVSWSPVLAEKGGFKHFMLKEIHEQPRALIDTFRGRISGKKDAQIFLDNVNLSQIPRRITIVGCGTSYHAGLTAKYMIEKLAKIPVELDLASEFRYRSPILDKDTLVLAISQSGETTDTIYALKEAKEKGASIMAICNVVDSSIARMTNESAGCFYTHAGPEIGVASTKAFTTQLVALYLLGVYLGQKNKILSPAEVNEKVYHLRQIPSLMEETLKKEIEIEKIARFLMNHHNALYLGRSIQYPSALEGALKLKEISYIHAEAYAAGEMKHGPIALIDEEMPVIAVATQHASFVKMESNLQEVHARGGKIIAFVTEGIFPKTDCEFIVSVPAVSDPLLEPFLVAIPLQLLAYYTADLKGTDVDQPRNLAKSVTVE